MKIYPEISATTPKEFLVTQISTNNLDFEQRLFYINKNIPISEQIFLKMNK